MARPDTERMSGTRIDDIRTLRHLKAAVEAMQLGFTLTDEAGTIVFTNPAGATMHGSSVDQLIGKDVGVFANSHQRNAMDAERLKSLNSWRRDSVNVRQDGSSFPVHLRSDVIAEPGQPVSVVTVCEDLSQRARSPAAPAEDGGLRAGAKDGLWDWDLRTNTIYFSARWKSMLGHDEADVADHPDEWFDRVHPDDRERVRAELAAHFEGRVPHFQSEHRTLHADGSYRKMLTRGVAVRDANGRTVRIAGFQTDISAGGAPEASGSAGTLHDPLTGLPNRALLIELVEKELARSRRRQDYTFTVMVWNLDRFNVVNDSLGHAVGNKLLAATAERLKPCFRPTDTFVRMNGDEFAVLLDDVTDASDATRVANRVRNQLMSPFQLDDQEVFTSACVGIAFGTRTYQDPEEVMRDADLALHRAKSRGTGCHEVFDKAMHQRANARLQLETDLRWALQREEFRTYYQPIVSLATGHITGVEALVRWEHPRRGLLLPADFLSVAEETGIIIPLGWRVLREACHQIADWQTEFPNDVPLTLAVNLSGKQFMESDTVEQIAQIIREAGVEAQHVMLEITETVIMNAESAMSVMSRLKALDVQLHLDDFGTGYASLSYLHLFPIDALKIDRSFVSHMGERRECAEIVRTIKALATSLGMQVVAEGVEAADQVAQLTGLQCDQAQGNYFSEPLDCESMAALIRQNRVLT